MIKFDSALSTCFDEKVFTGEGRGNFELKVIHLLKLL